MLANSYKNDNIRKKIQIITYIQQQNENNAQ